MRLSQIRSLYLAQITTSRVGLGVLSAIAHSVILNDAFDTVPFRLLRTCADIFQWLHQCRMDYTTDEFKSSDRGPVKLRQTYTRNAFRRRTKYKYRERYKNVKG